MEETDYRLAHLTKVLGERYAFEKLIGRGGFATVYRVRNLRLDRVEALKVLNENHGGEKEFSQRFLQEAKVAAALDHPSIIKIFDFGEFNGIFWYSMQLIEGITLASRLDLTGPLDEAAAARVALPVLDALDYSHRKGVIHRDIKPDNIILDERNRPYLMDFGIAKSTGSALKTQTGFVLGTPAYVAPEQATGTELDGRADIYSFGITLYEALTGKLPFEAKDGLQAVLKRLTDDPPLPSTKRPVAPEMESIVMKALARQREGRFSSASEMRQSLERFLARQTGAASLAGLSATGVTEETVVAFERPPSRVEAAPAPVSVGTAPPATAGATLRTAGPVAPPEPGDPRQTLAAPPGWIPAPPAPAPSPTTAVPSRVPTPPQRRSAVSPALAVGGLLAALVVIAGGSFALFRFRPLSQTRGDVVPEPAAPPATTGPAYPAPLPTAAPEPTPTAAPEPTPVRPTPVPAVERPAPRPSPRPAPDEPPVARRAVTPPQLEGEGSFSTPAGLPASCLGVPFVVSVRIGADGTVRETRLLGSGHGECTKGVIESVSTRRFRPALDAEDRPVDGRATLSLQFD